MPSPTSLRVLRRTRHLSQPMHVAARNFISLEGKIEDTVRSFAKS